MHVRYGQLRQLIRKTLIEGSERNDTVTLADGSTVTYGSPEHIDDMQAVLSGLENLKRQHRYGSAARAALASAGSHLKRLIARTSRDGQAVPPEQPRTFAQLEDDHGGLGRGSGGQGQYSPGFDRRM